MIRGAVVGFGQVAEAAHAPAWKASRDFEIVAAADDRPERLRRAAGLFPGIRVYPSMEDLFRGEPRLDFVDIATPPALHARQALSSLDKGCHVLCEKPLALRSADMRSLRRRGLARGRVVFGVHNWRYAPVFLKAVELVRAGAIGDARLLELHTLRTRPAADAAGTSWRGDPSVSGGGILVDHGWHNFYLVQAFLGPAPKAISAHLAFAGGVEDEAHCRIEYADASAVLYLSWRAASRSNWGVVYGTRGSLEIRDDRLVLSGPSGEKRFDLEEKLSAGSAHPLWFGRMLPDFAAEIEDPSRRHGNIREAETCLRLLTAAYKSHGRGGGSVALS